MPQSYTGNNFYACLNIAPTVSFEATVAVLAKALGIVFREDLEGKYEEYPAYRAFALGLEIALLAPPHPEFDIRESPINCFQLLVSQATHIKSPGVAVDLGALIETQLAANTDLELLHDPE